MNMIKLRDEYVVQYNLDPEIYVDEYWWLDYHSYTAIETATEDFWELVQDDDPSIGHRIVHRVTQITEEIVEPAWKMEIEE